MSFEEIVLAVEDELICTSRMKASLCLLFVITSLAMCLLASCASDQCIYRVKPAPSGKLLMIGTGFVRQGEIRWHKGITLEQAVREAGGLNQFANRRRVRVVTKFGELHWQPAVKEQKLSLENGAGANELQDGDVVIVDERVVTF